MKSWPVYPLTALLLLLCAIASGQTYHYVRQAIVCNGVKSSASGDGHYLTFTSQGLYESDGQGYSHNRGFIAYVGNDGSGLRCYEGNGFLGNNLVYRISQDYQRINVILPDKRIAVYVRSSSSGSERSYASNSSELSSYSQGGYSSSSSHSTSSSSSRKAKTATRCPGCGGHGYIEAHTPHASQFGTKKPIHKTCPRCGHSYDANAGHSCVRCKVCDGQGYIYK